MSDLEVRQFEANFSAFRTEQGAGLSDSKAFERYTAEQVLKDYDLSNEEIESGDFGGGDDGGIDLFYLFMHHQLITLATAAPVPAGRIELHLIQAKNEKGFKETAVEKLESFARDLLSYDKPVSSLTYLNSKARDAIANFREKYSDEVMGQPHTLHVYFHYSCRAEKAPGPNEKITTRSKNLIAYVEQVLPSAEVKFVPWPAGKLLQSARSVPQTDVVLPVTNHFSAEDGSTVCIVKLKDYAEKLLVSKDGDLQTRFLEPNVRDYNGLANPVNRQIRATLLQPPVPGREDFWWLNNGVTILANKCPVNGHRITIGNPEIVNGLQTSHEIFAWYQSGGATDDDRNVLLKIIIVVSENSRLNIVKSTNSQTAVAGLSFLATDSAQASIEDRLRLYNLFYDRKKGEYKRLKKPIKQIVGMGEMARAIIAIVLQKPDEARARPETFVKKNPDAVFDVSVDYDLYAASIKLDRQVEEYLEGQTALSSDEVRNIRFYISMLLGEALKLPTHKPEDIAAAIQSLSVNLPTAQMDRARDKVLKIYKDLGASDNVAKSSDMTKKVLASGKKPPVIKF